MPGVSSRSGVLLINVMQKKMKTANERHADATKGSWHAGAGKVARECRYGQKRKVHGPSSTDAMIGRKSVALHGSIALQGIPTPKEQKSHMAGGSVVVSDKSRRTAKL